MHALMVLLSSEDPVPYSTGWQSDPSPKLFVAMGCLSQVVEVMTGTVLRTLSGDSEPVTALAPSPDCKTLVVASRSTTCRLYSLETGACVRSWRPHKLPVRR